MKKIYTFLAILLSAGFANGQTPQAINYQGIARDASGNEYANTNIGIRIRITDVTSLGATLYEETHSITTNQFGLFVLEIGSGTATVGSFNSIDWSTNDKWLNVGMDASGGTAYTEMGSSQFVSVPYALYAETSGDGSKWSETGSDIYYNLGYVGIGTNTPKSDLEVIGDALVGDELGAGNTQIINVSKLNVNKNSASLSGEEAILSLTAHTSSDGEAGDAGTLIMGSTNVPGNRSIFLSSNDETTSGLGFKTRNATGEDYRMVIDADGNIGIGTTSPSEKLEVDGNIESTGFIMPTGAQNNYVLASDASGISSWVDPTTLVNSSLWSENGSDVFYNTGNVGIGTNTPNAKLNISTNASTSSDPFIELNDATAPSGFLRFRDLTSIANEFNPTIEAQGVGTGIDRTGLNIIGRLADDNVNNRGMLFDVKNSSGNRLTNAAAYIWRNDDSEIMRIDANDNLGLGTTSPKAKLEVVGNTYVGDELSGAANSSILTDPRFNVNRNSVSLTGEANILQLTAHTSADGNSGDAGTLLMGTTNVPGTRSIFFSSNDETTSGFGFKTRNGAGEDYRMVINADGEVGIGTTTPSTKLHVSQGDIYIDDNTKGIIMTAPNGTCYRVTVDNAGAFTSASITCP